MSDHYEKTVMIVDQGHRAVCTYCGVRHELDAAVRGKPREVRIGPCAPCAVRVHAEKRGQVRFGVKPLSEVVL